MVTLLFVHGTGVRGSDYDICFAAMQKQVKNFLPDVALEACLWGDSIGAKLLSNGASIPSYDSNSPERHLGKREVLNREEVRWKILYKDPLYEMRTLAALNTGDNNDDFAISPFTKKPSADMIRRLKEFEFSPQVTEELFRACHDITILRAGALKLLTESHIFPEVLDSPALADTVTRRMNVARAFVAAWMSVAHTANLPVLSGVLRDHMYADLVLELGGAPKGIKDLLSDAFVGLSAHIGTYIARRQRSALTDATFPMAADILAYQARGHLIRDFIAARLKQCKPPVYILAHSLGGIAAFELLAQGPDTLAEGLITAGSQAPFLYELDALATIRHGSPLPDHFPKWLNFYYINDFLSYIGAGIFTKRVIDIELKTGQPFPQSHSAYWTDATLWREIRAFIP
ncbi:hypothetical protein [Azohydromonas australica]|uniref:hypothetical protein n=1 Tax=Azohydromonas australica TaxID=364039 RepID=UPI0005BD0073|nr:hypothetical protein [Azohydromonas australica]